MRSSAFGLIVGLALSTVPVARATAQCLSAEFLKDNGIALNSFGNNVELDGRWLALSESGWKSGNVKVGAIHLYHFGAQGWSLSQTLIGPGGPQGGGFGASMALDGAALLVGAPGAGGNVFAYEETATGWVQTQVIPFPGVAADQGFGLRMALDGDRALIATGAYPPTLPLEVWLFERQQGQWTPVQELDPGPTVTTDWGWGHGLALEGDTAVVGHWLDASAGSGQHGAVYVFGEGASGWSLTQKLLHPDGPKDQQRFGLAVAIEGDWLFASSPSSSSGGPTSTIAVFESIAGSWQAPQVLRSGGLSQYGQSLDAVGDLLLAGTPTWGADGNLILHRRTDSGWKVEAAFDSPSYGAILLQLGGDVALDTTFLVGSAVQIPGANIGGAYVFDLAAGSTTTYCTGAANSVGPGAIISSYGPNSISANEFSLVAARLPPHVLGKFYYGPEVQQLPFGNGFACVGAGGLGTFRLLPLLQAEEDGMVARHLDFTLPPASSGAGQILPGSTWCFQYWYRDPASGGAGFNLSDAVSITFCP
jgi:hypothetical protein